MRTHTVQRLYGSLAARYDERWSQYVEDSLANVLAAIHVAPQERVLDIGCGTGQLLDRLLAREPTLRCIGVDLTPEMLTVARSRLGDRVTLVEASGLALPLPDASVNLVVSTSALHYIDEPVAFFREARRVLPVGGRLVVSDWCADYLAMRALGVVLRLGNRGHQDVLTLRACCRAVEAAGFAVTATSRARLRGWWGMMTVLATAR
ncbi:MAG: methyltransferase domain-containing protein [Gemmatimonadaceae bacterium]|nr:methyltransferase domain-containing protein [Gemmatimonadaceae bacterium]